MKKILENALNFNSDENKSFGKYSRTYLFTNENNRDLDLYKDGTKALVVTGSGDIIFDLLLKGYQQIDAVDISIYSEYITLLKLSAIKALTFTQFDKFFDCNANNSDFFAKTLYLECREYLYSVYLEFWDEIILKAHSNFLNIRYLLFNFVFFNNPRISPSNSYYFCEKQFNILKKLLLSNQIKLHLYNQDIFNLLDNTRKHYDLIHLSNIFSYLIGENKIEENKLTLYVKNVLNHTGRNALIIWDYIFGITEDNVYCEDSYIKLKEVLGEELKITIVNEFIDNSKKNCRLWSFR